MQFKFFNIKDTSLELNQNTLNKFLRTVKVLAVHKQFHEGIWYFAVEYIEDTVLASKFSEKINYKEILSDIEYARFRVLKECRKIVAYKRPAYVVFKDDQLSELVKYEHLTVDNLKSIKGFGEEKIKEFGQAFVDLYNSKQPDVEIYLKEIQDEKARKPAPANS